jgi:predicted RNA binding protein YcfA (HicA-like mRNA interferase family)
MKRRDFIQHLKQHDCVLLREGSRHSIFRNISNGKVSAVPRHNEISDFLVRKICRDLGIPIV